MSQAVRVRFAPSPTGSLHIGGLRAALYNFLFARHNEGVFILRIEDTDRERYVAEAEQYIKDSLDWCGMSYDEGPGIGGDKGPYHQSERKELYHTYVQQLLEAGHAYYAFDSKEELSQMRERLTSKENPAPRYDAITRMGMSNSFTLSEEEVKERMNRGDAYVIRLNVPQNEQIQFEDIVRGTVIFESSQIDDQILLKSDGMPTYHMANIVDDHLMGITHIIRGEEWLSSTPKHILLYRYLGWTPPHMAHLPLILSPNKGKLSKRKADKLGIPINVLEYKDAGYEPEPLINFLAFLGWNPGTEEEVFTLDGLVHAFTLERVGSAGVKFDLNKLNWYNQQFIKALPVSDLYKRIVPYLEQADIEAAPEFVEHVLELMQERLVLAKDFTESARYFFEDPESYDEKGVKKRWKQDSAALLKKFVDYVEGLEIIEAPDVEKGIKELAEAEEIGLGKIMAPLRLAVSGHAQGPDLFKSIELVGKKNVIRRINSAIDVLG